jgi:hypothetical protein
MIHPRSRINDRAVSMRVLICGGGVIGGFSALDWCDGTPLAPGARSRMGLRRHRPQHLGHAHCTHPGRFPLLDPKRAAQELDHRMRGTLRLESHLIQKCYAR